MSHNLLAPLKSSYKLGSAKRLPRTIISKPRIRILHHSMKFIYPRMLPTWHFMPFMPTYQSSPSMNLTSQLHAEMQQILALQYSATAMQPGNGTFVMPHVPVLISTPQPDQYHTFSAGPHQHRSYQSERGRHKTAASSNNHNIHASHSTITNDRSTVSHHSWVGDLDNARSGLAGGPPSSGTSTTPRHKSRIRAALQNRSKRGSAIRSQRKCDDLLQYVVANEGAECMTNFQLPSFI